MSFHKIYKMKKNIILLVVVPSIIFGSIAGCNNKDQLPSPAAVASLNVVNALPTSIPLIVAQGSITADIGSFYGVGPLSYGAIAVLTPGVGSEALYAVQKNADTASINTKGSDLMLDTVVSFTTGGLYSLYITGKDTTDPDFVFLQDILPDHTDSTVGIRFVNLSAGSGSVSVDIKGGPIGGEVSSLVYKGVSDFKNYSAISTISSYIFEFRDAVNGTLLASYTLSGVNTHSTTVANTVLFRNITIALIGQPTGGKVPQSCIRINSF